MARHFVAASTQFLSRSNIVRNATPLTIACWYKPVSTGADYILVNQGAAGNTDESFMMYQTSSGAIAADVRSSAGGVHQALTSTSPTAGVWNHACAVFASTTSRSAYLNGGGKATNTGSNFPSAASLNNTLVGTWSGSSLYMNGDIAEVSIWDIALSDAEVASLYVSAGVGVYPSEVQAGHLIAYWPLLGSSSPEPDDAGSNDLTVTGATSATHLTMQNLVTGPVAVTTALSNCRAGYLGSTGGDFHEPAIYYDTTYVAPTPATTFTPADAAAFQTALNSAVAGDEIRLTAGVTYTTGTGFTLPVKTGSSYIHIRSSAALTTEGTRVTPATAASFPRIVTNTNEAAIQAAPGAFYYRFINCDITSGSTATNGGLVRLGTGNETVVADFPHHIIFDRCWIHGHATSGGRRGVLFSGNYQAVIDSYVSDWKEVGADTQAICAWTGYGPYKITNCYLEGAGENVMFGGADTWIPGLTPSDIEVRDNHFFKPLTWQFGHPSYLGVLWTVKNIFELKHARRVMCENNLFENCWPAGQNGYGIVFTVRNQQGSNSWATVQDVTFRNNEVRNSSNAINCLGQDFEAIVYPGGTPSQIAQRCRITDNLITLCGEPAASGVGNFVLITSGYADITIDHNTALHTGNIITVDYAASPGFRFTNNICQHNAYGILGTDHGSGNDTIAYYFPGSVITGNVIQSATNYSSVYPSGNFWPATLGAIGFTNYPTDLSLSPSSPYHNAGTDGTDIGYIATAVTFKAAWAASCNQMII